MINNLMASLDELFQPLVDAVKLFPPKCSECGHGEGLCECEVCDKCGGVCGRTPCENCGMDNCGLDCDERFCDQCLENPDIYAVAEREHADAERADRTMQTRKDGC